MSYVNTDILDPRQRIRNPFRPTQSPRSRASSYPRQAIIWIPAADQSIQSRSLFPAAHPSGPRPINDEKATMASALYLTMILNQLTKSVVYS